MLRRRPSSNARPGKPPSSGSPFASAQLQLSLRLWMPWPPLVPRYLWQVAGRLLYHNPRTQAVSPRDPLGDARRQRNNGIAPGRPPMDRTKKISEEVRVAQVRQLFVAQHPDPAKRTVTSVLIFYAWLEGHRPELLPQGKNDDPLQYLESDLSGLYQA